MSDIDTIASLVRQNTTLYRALEDIEALLNSKGGVAVTCTDDYEIVQRIMNKIIELKKSKNL